MLGASFGRRCGSVGQIIVESCSRSAALPAIGAGGNGSTEPSLTWACATTVRQSEDATRKVVYRSGLNRVFEVCMVLGPVMRFSCLRARDADGQFGN